MSSWVIVISTLLLGTENVGVVMPYDVKQYRTIGTREFVICFYSEIDL